MPKNNSKNPSKSKVLSSKPKHGFFIKNMLVIGNGEYLLGPRTTLDKHILIYDDGARDLKRGLRIVKQVQSIAEYAVKHHNVNRLTRVVTNEFSFYTRATPLSLDEYKKIINTLALQLKSLPPNIILIISSMPVLWSDGKIRNVVLHIQSPNPDQEWPTIHHISKERFSDVDPLYNKSGSKNKNYYDYGCDDYSSKNHSPNVILKDTKIKCNDPNQHKSSIIVKGWNLPPIIDTIDVCLDHKFGVGWRNASELTKNKRITSIPFYISHIITSHTVKQILKYLTSNPVHADQNNIQVGTTPRKTVEVLPFIFGCNEKYVHLFHKTRAEILTSTHFFNAEQQLINTATQSITNLVDNHNNTLLHQIFFANKNSEFDEVSLWRHFNELIPHFSRKDINKKNKDGNTVLHLALSVTKNTGILLHLLHLGASLTVKNKRNQNPIELSCSKEKWFILNLLKEAKRKNIPISESAYLTIIKMEFQLRSRANKVIVGSAFSHLSAASLKKPSGIYSLSIAEQFIAYAFSIKNPQLLDHPKLIPFLNSESIEKIAKTFNKRKNDTEQWLHLSVIKNELLREESADLDRILLHLPKIKNLNQLTGVNSLTLAEELVAQAYFLNDRRFLAKLKLHLPNKINQTMIRNIANTFFDKRHAYRWFSQQIKTYQIKKSGNEGGSVIQASNDRVAEEKLIDSAKKIKPNSLTASTSRFFASGVKPIANTCAEKMPSSSNIKIVL